MTSRIWHQPWKRSSLAPQSPIKHLLMQSCRACQCQRQRRFLSPGVHFQTKQRKNMIPFGNLFLSPWGRATILGPTHGRAHGLHGSGNGPGTWAQPMGSTHGPTRPKAWPIGLARGPGSAHWAPPTGPRFIGSGSIPVPALTKKETLTVTPPLYLPPIPECPHLYSTQHALYPNPPPHRLALLV